MEIKSSMSTNIKDEAIAWVQNYFKKTYNRETKFIPNGVNCPKIKEIQLVKEKYGLEKDSYILYLGRLVPEKV